MRASSRAFSSIRADAPSDSSASPTRPTSCPSALTSAINASARELGRQLDGKPFYEMHHAGAERQVFMARASAGAQELLFVGIFNRESSLGVVEIYFAEFQKALERLQPEKEAAGEGPSGDFEGELNRSLDALFGPIGKH